MVSFDRLCNPLVSSCSTEVHQASSSVKLLNGEGVAAFELEPLCLPKASHEKFLSKRVAGIACEQLTETSRLQLCGPIPGYQTCASKQTDPAESSTQTV